VTRVDQIAACKWLFLFEEVPPKISRLTPSSLSQKAFQESKLCLVQKNPYDSHKFKMVKYQMKEEAYS